MILSHDPDFFDLLVSSYRRAVGRDPAFLERGAPRSADWLYAQASHPVLAHNTDPDPRFIYANRAAQTAFEYDWDEITGLPSRLSAEPVDREERQRLLDRVVRHGFATGYSGVRRPALPDRGRCRLAAHRPRRRGARPGRDLRPLARCVSGHQSSLPAKGRDEKKQAAGSDTA